MRTKSKLLATLSVLALGTVQVGTVTGMAMSVASAQEVVDIRGLVTKLVDNCLVRNTDDTYSVVSTAPEIRACCEVVREAGPENYDFVQAVATGNPNDPRLLTLRAEIVTVLLTYCQDVALEKVAQIALETIPAAGPGVAYGP